MSDERLDRIAELMKELETVTDQASGIRDEIVTELRRLRASAANDRPAVAAERRVIKKRRARRRRKTD